MSCSAWPAKFSKTITGAWEVLIDGTINHVIWYQNRVGEEAAIQTDPNEMTFQWLVMQRNIGRDLEEFQEKMDESNIHPSQVEMEVNWRRQGGKPRRLKQLGQEELPQGNCLIIPIMGSWESIKLLNTADMPRLLMDIDNAVQLPDGGASPSSRGTPYGQAGGDSGRTAFLQFDVYDVVLAEDASRIEEAIESVDPEKRPDVSSRVFKRLEQYYRCPLAICCFKSSQQAEAKPIGFAFKPVDPDQIVVYTLDAHDGYPPNPYSTVELDHTIFVGSYRTPEEYTAFVNYRDQIPYELRPYLLDRVMGMPLNTQMFNGDFVFDTAAVRAGCFNGLRALPRYSPAQHKEQNRITRKVAYGNGKRSLTEKKSDHAPNLP